METDCLTPWINLDRNLEYKSVIVVPVYQRE